MKGGIIVFYPSLDEVKKLSGRYNIIPVAMEVYADMETPISLFKRFEENNFCFLLESVEGGEKWARYSFIGKDPFLTIKSINGKTIIEGKNHEPIIKEGNPVEILKSVMDQYKAPKLPGMPRFNGGAVGCFGYDLIRYYENLPNAPKDELNIPECHFMLSDEVIAFDHLKQKIHIIVNIHVSENVERSYNTAIERVKEIYREIRETKWKIYSNSNPVIKQRLDRINGNSNIKSNGNANLVRESGIKYESNVTKERFCQNVCKAKEYIKNGDIFQVVLSQRLSVDTEENPFNVYRALRVINPSSYMYYLKFDGYTVVGASPEMLVRVEDKDVETCPIAGTRKRGLSQEEDKEIEADLLADPKEVAEHMMLVDLGRNDVGKVSEFGTVEVRNLMHIEKYSHVMHMVTNVKGRLRKDKTAFDALMSVLPAGTVSGAPKIRAMSIIDELETTKRGIYAGAIGYLSFNGNIDSCITIRTILFKGRKAYVQAGAGIVADSVPEKEYQETLNKAAALLKALEEAGEIL